MVRKAWIIGIVATVLLLGITVAVLYVLWRLGYIFKKGSCAPYRNSFSSEGKIEGNDIKFDIGFQIFGDCPKPDMTNTSLIYNKKYPNDEIDVIINEVSKGVGDVGYRVSGILKNKSIGRSSLGSGEYAVVISVAGEEGPTFPIIVPK